MRVCSLTPKFTCGRSIVRSCRSLCLSDLSWSRTARLGATVKCNDRYTTRREEAGSLIPFRVEYSLAPTPPRRRPAAAHAREAAGNKIHLSAPPATAPAEVTQSRGRGEHGG